MWQLRNGGEVALQSFYSLFGFGSNWNLTTFMSATAQATETLAASIEDTPNGTRKRNR